MKSEIVDPLVAEHGGRVFKTTGDGLLAEFPSAVEALRCALAVQTRLRGDPAVLQLRIGLHQGDVVVAGDDLLGDGVNIAARLEPLAEAGGIVVSARVREDAQGKLDIACDDLGTPPLKNIDAPVRVFRVRAPGLAESPPTLPEQPSLAVLPFTNLSGDAEQEYFADGVVEDIITALSRVGGFFVIARNSSFTYKGRNVDVKQVGRELGVRYVLEGSIRKVSKRVRVAGQLIEAETGHHVWADRFDGDLEDMFDLQDQVTESVVGAIEPNLRIAEVRRAAAKPTESLTAYDLYLRALPFMHSYTREGNDAALGLLHRAIALDANFARAKASLAWIYTQRAMLGQANPGEKELGVSLARQAAIAGNDDPETLRLAGHVMGLLAGDIEQALDWAHRALRLNPNSATVALSAGLVHCYAHLPEEAARLFQRAIRLSPLDPSLPRVYAGITATHLMMGRDEEALAWSKRSLREAPNFSPMLRVAIVAHVRIGQLEEAKRLARHLLSLDPSHRIEDRLMPYRNEVFRNLFKNALLAAGVPG